MADMEFFAVMALVDADAFRGRPSVDIFLAPRVSLFSGVERPLGIAALRFRVTEPLAMPPEFGHESRPVRTLALRIQWMQSTAIMPCQLSARLAFDHY
jgi:hypothetical protein